ncbi:MAG: hypothetical protein J2P16_17585, partial [Mycobacterium sp.]|nr:hypothetical protein [Mycobacterium sp.]
MVVVAGGGPNLVLAGGLLASGTTTARVTALNTVTGQSAPMASLPEPAHDAAGAMIAGRVVVFGGGAATTTAVVQSSPLPGTGGAPARQSQLPQPRSDSAGATIGHTSYVVGGFDGANATPQVLATDDGRTFHVVTDLAVPVRYPAVAAQGGELYVFGGEGMSGNGHDMAAIQRVDITHGRTTVVGQLPFPLTGAAAFTLHGQIYVAGGQSTAAPPMAPGAGTTQLGGWASAPSQSPSSNTSVSTVWAFDSKSGRLTAAG